MADFSYRWIFLALIFCPLITLATVYQGTDAQGNTIFSDQPIPGGKPVILNSVQTYQPAVPKTEIPSATESQTSNPKQASYKSLQIVSPQNDEAIRQNEGIVVIQAQSIPNLMEGHSYVLLLDHNRAGKPQTSPTFVLTNVDRGTHSVQVQIVDSSEQVMIQSPSITFHLLRYVIQSAPMINPLKPNSVPLPLSDQQIEVLKFLQTPQNLVF